MIALPEIRLVFASAGSGKTYALALRYLELIMGATADGRPVPQERILAVTFTNKAAWEMKARILDFLKTLALDLPGAKRDAILERVGSPVAGCAEIRGRAEETLARIFRDYRTFQVQTIDSFVNAVIKACAFRLDLRPDFEVRDDNRDFVAYGLDLALESAAGDGEVRAEMERLLEQYLRLSEFPGWNPAGDIRQVCADLLRMRNAYLGDFTPAARDLAEVYQLRRAVMDNAARLLAALPDGVHATFRKSLANFVARRGTGFSLDNLSAYFDRDEIPVRRGVSAPPEAAALLAEIRAGLEQIAELEPAALFNDYLAVFRRVERGISSRSQLENTVFLDELNRRMHEIVAGSVVEIPEIFCRLATRFGHYLLDEFQDTSRLQWANLQPLVEDALASGGTLFCVGDRKQAIYRFRGGDDRLMAELRDGARFRACRPTPETLGTNYRSGRAIVDFNNRLFSRANLERFVDEALAAEIDESAKVFEVFAEAAQVSRPDLPEGYVRVTGTDAAGDGEDTGTEDLRQLLAGTLAELGARGFSWDAVALLCRTNAQVEQVTGWLLEENIPVQSEKTLNLRENRHVQELVSFLRFLQSPIDNLSFAAFAGGDIFRRAAGLSRDEVYRFLFACRHRRARYLYPAFRAEFGESWHRLIEEFFSRAGFYPPYELVVSILQRLEVLEYFPGDQGFFMRLLELIREQEPEPGGIADFLEFFDDAPPEKLYVRAPLRGAVRVMSVHAAKGLEFPVVLLPFFLVNAAVNRGGGYGEKGSRPFNVHRRENEELELVRLSRGYQRFSGRHDALYRRELRLSLVDELNAAYVALTRAERELHVFIPAKAGNGRNLATVLVPGWTGSRFELGRPARQAETAPDAGMTVLSSPRYPDWLTLLEDEFVRNSDITARPNVARGRIRHALLAVLEAPGGEAEAETALDRALAGLRPQYPFYGDDFFSGIKAEVLALARDERYRPLFFPSPGVRVFAEKEVVTPGGETRVIDRLLVGPETVTVVEFKSSRAGQAEQRRQLAEYLELARAVYPGRAVTGRFLYLDEPDRPDETMA